MECIDSVLDGFHLARYYSKPRFHISFGWDKHICKGDVHCLQKEFRVIKSMVVDRVRCTIGDKEYHFDLL